MSLKLETAPTISTPEPSELVKASPLLMTHFKNGVIPLQELERRARGAERLKEACSSTPFYTERAKKDPDYWHKFYAGMVNW